MFLLPIYLALDGVLERISYIVTEQVIKPTSTPVERDVKVTNTKRTRLTGHVGLTLVCRIWGEELEEGIRGEGLGKGRSRGIREGARLLEGYRNGMEGEGERARLRQGLRERREIERRGITEMTVFFESQSCFTYHNVESDWNLWGTDVHWTSVTDVWPRVFSVVPVSMQLQ